MQKYTKYFIYKKNLHTLYKKNKPSAPIPKKNYIGREMIFHHEENLPTSGGIFIEYLSLSNKQVFYKIISC